MPSPRTLLFSQRNLSRMVYQGLKYEFEDVIAEVDSVELITPRLTPASRFDKLRLRALNRVRKSLDVVPRLSMEETRVTGYRDLFFAVFLLPEEVLYMNELKGWRESASSAACFLGEVWTKDAALLRRYAPIFREFDHIFLHVGASRTMFESIVGRPSHLLHAGVDALRFCPFPTPPARVVDCYSFGRRAQTTHQALLRLASQRQFFYIYDTVTNFPVINSMEHRRLTAEMIKRSRYFMAHKHNVNATNQTGGDEALGSRLFEGVAGGAVLLGLAPDCPEFGECFDWPDAVIPLPVELSDVAPFFSDLDAQTARLQAVRRRNVLETLSRHDWSHRWARILDTVGLKPLDGLEARAVRLNERAQMAGGLQ